MNYKHDFPIFKNNLDLIYFDSTASSQKPKLVIDSIKEYLETNYSNIHRWSYDIAINSEKLYKDSKKLVAKHIWADDYREIIYTWNSTYAANLLTLTLKKNNFLKAWDKVIISTAEHHANIVPWLILKEEIGIEVVYLEYDENYNLDLEQFEKIYDDKVKIISLTHVSNVLGQRFDLEEIWKRKRKDTLFVIDASQSIPHFAVNIKTLNCDFLFFTGHKVFADSWIWVLWGKYELLNSFRTPMSWGWAIWDVTFDSYTDAGLPDKFEFWTPNVTGAVSLLKAFEYIDSIGGYEVIEAKERELIEYFLERFNKLSHLKMLWSTKSENRVWVFSFIVEWIHSHDVAEALAEKGIAVRAGKHCAHPLFYKVWLWNSVRVSFQIYNNKEDIDKLFEVLSSF